MRAKAKPVPAGRTNPNNKRKLDVSNDVESEEERTTKQRGHGGPKKVGASVLPPAPSAAIQNGNAEDTIEKYTWTLLKCWSKRMYNAFEAHIQSNYLEYSKRGLGKKFYTTIHGQKRKISMDDPEFQIFEISRLGKLESLGNEKVHKLQVEATEIKCANNVESGRPLPRWILSSYMELAETLHTTLKEKDYLAIWGAKYSKNGKSALLNSYGESQVPDSVLAFYRHESSFDPAKSYDQSRVATQEKIVSHYLTQADENGICDFVQEIYPRPRTDGEQIYDDHEELDAEGGAANGHDEVDDEVDRAKGSPKPPSSAQGRKIGSTPTGNAKSPSVLGSGRKPRSLSNNAIMRELESRSPSPSNSLEILAEFDDDDSDASTVERAPKNSRNTSKSKPSPLSVKNRTGRIASDSEEADDGEDSDASFVPNKKKRSLRSATDKESPGASQKSTGSTSTFSRPKRNATKIVPLVDVSDSEDEPLRKETPKKVVDDHAQHEESQGRRKSPRKASQDKSSQSKSKGKANESGSQLLSQPGIVIELETQNFAAPPNSNNNSDNMDSDDNDSDWKPPEADGSSGEDNGNDKDENSDSEAIDVVPETESDSDEESLETKRQKLGGTNVVRKLIFPEEEEEVHEGSTRTHIPPSEWDNIISKKCVVKINPAKADRYTQQSSGSSSRTSKSKGSKRTRKR